MPNTHEASNSVKAPQYAFALHIERPRPLLIGTAAGLQTLVQLCDQLRTRTDAPWQPLVLLGSDSPFAFRSRPSRIVVPGMPDGTIACMPQLEQWSIASRLASRSDFPGCFDGEVTELAAIWLQQLDREALADIEILACGGAPLLAAASTLAQQFGVPCQRVPAEEPSAG